MGSSGILGLVEGRMAEGEGLCDLLEMGSESNRRPQRFPATELGMRLGGLDLRNFRKGVGLPLAYLLSLESSPWISRDVCWSWSLEQSNK